MSRFLFITSAALFAASTAIAQPATQFTPDSLTRALWHFNETSGPVVHDTASGNDGTAYGTAVTPGRFGNARLFNGYGEYINVPSNTAFDFDTSGFTIDVWFKTTQSDGIIMRRGLTPEPGFMISLLHGHIVGMIGNRVDLPPPNALLSDTSTGTYNDDVWHIATMVRDRSARKLFLYVDGVMTGNPAADSFSIPLNSSRPLTFGCWENPSYPSYYYGAIDEVRISGQTPVGSPLAIAVQPTTLNFGWVPAHTSDTLALQFKNTGYRDTLRVYSISSGNPYFGVSEGAFAIPPRGSRTIAAWYSPAAGKVIGDTTVLLITCNDPALPTTGVLAYGFGYASNPPTSAFTPDSATRALWHFDETSGTLVHDTAAGNDGSATGTTIIPGRFGNARSFNGNGDYVIVPSSTMFDFDTSSFSIDVWFRSNQGAGIILRRGLAPEPGFMISLFQNGRVVGMIGNRSDSYWPDELLSDTSVASYNDNIWHCVTMVRDRNARRLFLYVDGILAGPPAVDNFTLPLNSSRPLTVGRWEADFNPSYFSGSVDEVRISSPKLVRWPVRITVQPARLDFGGVRVSARDTLGIQVANAGYRDTLRISSITSSNPRFSVSGGQAALGPGSHHTFEVVYTPTKSQADTGGVTILCNDPSFSSIRIPVTGQGFAVRDTPVITGIAFIPNTYTQARISWTRSSYDTAGAADPVTGYSVWHRIPVTGSGSQPKGTTSGTLLPADSPGPTWEFIQGVPAIGLDTYSLILQVPVTVSGTNSWQVYMVVAQTRSLVTFMSAPDSIRGITLVGIKEPGNSQAPEEVTLNQNYPNPFNPSTIIRFGLPSKAVVSLVVYNTLGQNVATLMEGEQEAGYHEVRFEGSNLASGIYLCRLKAGDVVRSNKILLLR